MNKRHCQTISRLGGNGDKVYDNLDKKMEEMWRCVYSDPTPSDEDDADVVYDTLDQEKEEIWPRRHSNPTMAQFSSARAARSNRRPPLPPGADYSYHQSYSHPHYHSPAPPPPPPGPDYFYHQSYSHPHYHSPPPPPPPGPDYSFHQSYSPRRHLIPNTTRHRGVIRGPPEPDYYGYGVPQTYQYANTYPPPH